MKKTSAPNHLGDIPLHGSTLVIALSETFASHQAQSSEFYPKQCDCDFLKEDEPLTTGYSCAVELLDEGRRDQEVLALLSPEIMSEIIYPIRGFVDGIVLIIESSGSFFAISFSRSLAVDFWISPSDDARVCQN
jgi:hypothetical protein